MNSPAQPSYGKRVLWYFIAFFALVAAVNAAMVTVAIRTHTGTVTEHPYEKGLAYNKVVDAEAAQKKLGWKGEITVDKGILHFTLRDTNGKPLVVDSATAHFSRPTQAGMDVDVPLKNGQAQVDLPINGLWEVRVFAKHGNESYQQSKRVVIE